VPLILPIPPLTQLMQSAVFLFFSAFSFLSLFCLLFPGSYACILLPRSVIFTVGKLGSWNTSQTFTHSGILFNRFVFLII